MTPEEVESKIKAEAHRIQSATAFLIERNVQAAGATPKHLRTGLNVLFAQDEGLARLLIAKGVFTEEEYAEAQIAAYTKEGDRLTEIARQETGIPSLDFA